MDRLPVPEIQEETVFQHSFKQANRREDTNRLRPPKLKSRYYHDSNCNRSQSFVSISTSALAISFRENGELCEPDSLPLNPYYDRFSNQTYFEQCFTCLAKIGEGSFGEVFKVRSKEDNLLYAVKMSKQMFRSGTYRQERLEEVRRYQQLSGHANCVQFYRAWEQDDRLYMQMELCRENLECYLLRRHQLPESKIWSILLDLLLALKSLHDLNLIHLDIKLDNVLIGDDDTCKLADFGLVIDVQEANLQPTEGDSRYIAPEIMQGKFTKAADIFSLGIAMLELSCCLELPSNGPLWQQLRSGVLPENFIKSISLELQAVIKDMMTPNPAARPTVDQLLSHNRLESILRERKRWQFVKQMKQFVRCTPRMMFKQLTHIKHTMYALIFWLLTTFKPMKLPLLDKATMPSSELLLNAPNVRIVPIGTYITPVPTTRICEPSAGARINFVTKGSAFSLSQQNTPQKIGTDNMYASTPLNHNQSFRSRKDLKTSFTHSYEMFALADPTTNFLTLDELEPPSHSFVRKAMNSSGVRGKKLFLDTEIAD